MERTIQLVLKIIEPRIEKYSVGIGINSIKNDKFFLSRKKNFNENDK